MKNGRFSLKNTGKRWFTSTWKASLSTWLKSGLTVASSVIVDVMPYFTLAPKSPFVVGAPHALRRRRALVASRRSRSESLRATARLVQLVEDERRVRSRTPTCPAACAGHDHDTPMRLTAPEEQHAHPHVVAAARSGCSAAAAASRRCSPSVVHAAGALPDPVRRRVLVRCRVFSASIWMPLGLTNMWYATWPVRVESRLIANPVVVPRVVAPADRRADLRSGSASKQLEREVESRRRRNATHTLVCCFARFAAQRVVGHPLVERQRLARPGGVIQHPVQLRRRCRALRTQFGVCRRPGRSQWLRTAKQRALQGRLGSRSVVLAHWHYGLQGSRVSRAFPG